MPSEPSSPERKQRTRPLRLFATVTGGLFALVAFVHLAAEWWTRQPPNYTQIEQGLYLGAYVKNPPPGKEAVLNLCEAEDPYDVAIPRWAPIPDTEPGPDVDWLRRQVEFIE